jgi:ABC-type oligopeptide transport system substrate-binding subunit/class 3 adenylate cyclase
MKCVNCGTENDRGAEFCENCGSPLKRACARCGSPLKSGAKFCNKCGSPVSTRAISRAEEDQLAALRQAAPPELKEKIRTASLQDEGQRKPVTILFTDIVGSTAMAEKLDPEEWKEIVSGAHRRVIQAVYRYEGTIAQLLGDGVLAFFGAPVTHEDDPTRAVRAALDIQAAIADYRRELQGYVDDFQMRIGINTGLVVVASVGSDLHMEYLAIGDAVNLAARLQSAAQSGKVLISDNTQRLVKAAFELYSLGEISVKGKAQPVAVFEVVVRKAAPERGRGFEELSSPLVGRDSELTALRSALEALQEGHGQIVAVIGEAGIGKSRLIEEARRLVAGEADDEKSNPVHWLEGRALSYGQSLSFWTITQLIQADLGLVDGDPEPRIRAALKRRTNALFGAQSAEALPYLAKLLGVRLDDDLEERLRLLDGETLKRQTLLSISRYFEQLAREKPTVLVFEDLHWADPSSIQALQQLLALTDRAPILLLLLFRLERDLPSWCVKQQIETDYAHRYTEIALKPLSPAEQNSLVDNLLVIADLPENVRRLILERAEGNPFYLEEIVRSLIDQGGIVRTADGWQAMGDIQKITIPDTLQGVLLARIDRLQEDTRRILQLASVIGKSFLYRLLEAITEAEVQLDRQLSMLQRVDLVREKARLPELEYMFKHSLTQEAAYNSLLIERRQEFHRRVGQALEDLFAERKEDFLGILAHHFDAAGEREKAIEYLIQAGDRARQSDEHTEAVGFYQRAVELLIEPGDERQAAQTWLKLGLLYHANFQFEDAHQANETAFILQKRTDRFRQPSQVLPQRSLHLAYSGDFVNIDPGKSNWGQDNALIDKLFSGLVEADAELNIVPDVAHSWQVLDGGRRYVFYLRDDVRWTDGLRVTAQDFEWTWKRNLSPQFGSETARFLYDIIGAQDYHQGHNLDPESVCVRALDELTLEVRLAQPVAYFPFIMIQSVSLALPRAAIERYGEDWCQPGRMVSNGPFRLVEFDALHGCTLERNPTYHREFPGNMQRIEWINAGSCAESFRVYQEDEVDLAYVTSLDITSELPASEKFMVNYPYFVYIAFSLNTPPLDDLRVRKALSFALDRKALWDRFNTPYTSGGLVPRGMPGHSPDLGLHFDPEIARRLLAEAGYPAGQRFPALKGIASFSSQMLTNEIHHQWHTNLGIDLGFKLMAPPEIQALRHQVENVPFLSMGFIADYPDPDNILRSSDILDWLHRLGWQDAAYDRLVESAAQTQERAKRMAMYRQADRYLVEEQVLALILPNPRGQYLTLVKPWVKNYQRTPLGRELYQNFIIEEH